MENLIQTIANRGGYNDDKSVNEKVCYQLQSVFKTVLEYVDTFGDEQVFKRLIAKFNSVTFKAKHQGIESKQGRRSARCAFEV